jgi:hypothetical protein
MAGNRNDTLESSVRRSADALLRLLRGPADDSHG